MASFVVQFLRDWWIPLRKYGEANQYRISMIHGTKEKCNELRWYGTPSSSDVLFIKINIKMKYNFINSFFQNLSPKRVTQWIKGFTAWSLLGILNFLPFQTFLKSMFWLKIWKFENSESVKLFYL